MRKSILSGMIVLAIVFMGMVFPVQAEEGVSDSAVHIGQTGPLSGPAAIWGGTVQGAALRFRMANENGGIHGRKIVHHVYDDAYNPARTKSGVKRLQESVGIFAWIGGVGTSNGLAVKDYLLRRKVPWVGPMSGSRVWFDPPRRTIFTVFAPYIFEAEALCEYAVNELGKRHIAIVYQDDGYGRSGLQGARAALKKMNQTLVASIPVERNAVDMVSVCNRLRKGKADVVLLWMGPFGALRMIKVAQQMEYTPQWMASSTLSMCSTFYSLSRGLVEGLITANYAVRENPLLQKYRSAQEKLAPADEWNSCYLMGVCVADILLEAMQRCGRELTRERLIKSLESLDGYETLTRKCFYAPFDPDDPLCRLGTRQIYLQQCMAGGEAKQLTKWIDIEYQ